MKREAGAIPLSYAYIRRPLIKNRIKGTEQHTESMAPAPGQSRKRMRENYVISIRLEGLGHDWSISKGHSITETVQSSVSACFSIEILLIIIPVVTIPMMELS